MSCSRLSWAWNTASADASRVGEQRAGASPRCAAAIGEAAPGEERLGEVARASPRRRSSIERLQAGAVGAGLGPEDARAHGGGERASAGRHAPARAAAAIGLAVVVFVERGDGADGRSRSGRSAPGKASRNMPEICSVTSMRGRPSSDSGMTRKPVTRPVPGFPHRLGADQRQHLRRCRRRRSACSTCPRPTWRSSAATRPRPGNSGAPARRPPRGRAPRPRRSARRAHRRSRNCGRSAARPAARASARRTGPGGTKRPSRAASTAAISASPEASRAGARSARDPVEDGAVRATRPPLSSPASGGPGRRATRRPCRLATARHGSPLRGDERQSALATSSAASTSIRSTVSPRVRHGASETAASAAGRGPVQGAARSQSSGSKPRPRSAAMARCSEASAGRPPERGTRAIATSVSIRCRPVRRRAEHVQPVADLHLLQLAEMRVERAQRLAAHRRA